MKSDSRSTFADVKPNTENMKKFISFSIAFVLFGLSVSMAQNQATSGPQPGQARVENPNAAIASFDKTMFDMGNLPQGIPAVASFTLTNDGKEPLIISSAKASCGCTNLKYEKDPVLPGKSTQISVTYNAAAPGNFVKTITVNTNASEKPVVLSIKGTVEPKKEEPKS